MATLDKFGIAFGEVGLGKLTSGVGILTGKIGALTKEATAMTGIFAAAFVGLERFSSYTIASVNNMNNIARATGLSTIELEKFGRATELLNPALSSEQALSQLQGLQKNITSLLMGLGGNAEGFQMLGIDISSGNAVQVFDSIRNAIRDIDDVRAIPLIEKMGLTADMLPMLRATRKEFDLFSQGKFLSQKQRKDVELLGTQFKRLKFTTVDLRNEIVANLSPALSLQLQSAVQWLTDNGDKISSVFESATYIIGRFGDGVVNIGGAISMLLDSNYGIIGLSAAGLLLARRFFPLTTAMTGFYLVIEDIAAFFAGKSSFTGDIVKWYQSLSDSEQTLIKITGLVSALSVAIFGLNFAIKKNPIMMGLTLAGLAYTGLKSIDWGGKDEQKQQEQLLQSENLRKSRDAIFSSITGGDKDTYTPSEGLYPLEQSAITSLNGRDTMRQNTNNTNVTINIDGSGDPEEVARMVEERITEQLRNLEDSLL
jgi:hypothetical protein